MGNRLAEVVVATLFASVSLAAEGQKMPTLNNDHAVEEKMAEWLAHPAEFGVRPTSIHLKHTYKARLITYGDVDIHLVNYTMPDGKTGRGFVNGALTWSFESPEVNSINDNDLFVAYCGWAWLFPPLQQGTVQTEFESTGEEAKYLAAKRLEGLTAIEVTTRYKIRTSELIEFRAMRRGVPVKGAGDTNGDVIFEASDPRYNLPSIYFLLGRQVIESVH